MDRRSELSSVIRTSPPSWFLMSDSVMMSEYVISRCHGARVSLHALTTGIKQEDQGMLSQSCDESESCSRIPARCSALTRRSGLHQPGLAELRARAPLPALLQFSGHCPSSVWASATDQPAPSPALPSPHSPTSPCSRLTRDIDFPYATKIYNKKNTI